MAKLTIFNPMKKRGVVDIFSLIVFIVVAGSITGATFVLIQEGKQVDVSGYYVGDISTNKVYSIDCIDKIPENQRILFRSVEIAKNLNFTYTKC